MTLLEHAEMCGNTCVSRWCWYPAGVLGRADCRHGRLRLATWQVLARHVGALPFGRVGRHAFHHAPRTICVLEKMCACRGVCTRT